MKADWHRKRICLLASGLLAVLVACSSAPPAATTPAATAVRTSPASGAPQSSSGTTTILEVSSGGDNQEQQRLIDEINRIGSPLEFTGLRDPAPEAVAPEGGDVVELNYEQADLRLVLEELADALDISIVIDPSIDHRVSVRTSPNRPLNRVDIWPLIRLLTRDAGVSLEQVGNLYNARQISGNLPAEITTPDNTATSTAAEVLQVTPLIYVSTESAIEVLSPIVDEGAINRLTNTNVLAISGSPSQLQRVNQLLLLIDADPFVNRGIQLYQLRNSSAVEVAEELQEILILIEGPSPSYQLRGIERINAILVTAPATRGFEEVSRWIQILDADNQEQVEQLFHYRAKNLNAVELADTLTEVFEDQDDDGGPQLQPDDSRPGQGATQPSTIGATGGRIGSTRILEQTQTFANDDQATAAPDGAGQQAVSANLQVRIVADEATNSLLIRSTARDYRQLLTTINQLDVVPLQVMVNAVIAQVTLTDETRFGVDWSRVANDAQVDDISTSLETQFVPEGGLGGLMFSKSFVDGAARVEATLDAIAANNDVRLLARPTLTVTNNQEGEIQIGSQVPVEQGDTVGAGGTISSSVGYVDTGIELFITPQINNDGIINLVITQVLSSVDNSRSGIRNNPVFNRQEITTTVVVRDAENVVLGGLIQEDNQSLNTGVPGLNRLPVVGNLFSYQQELMERKELFIVLRPEIINLNEPSALLYSDILERFRTGFGSF